MSRNDVLHFQNTMPEAEINRSTFDMSHGYKTTFNLGELVPFEVIDVLPGDSFKVNTAKVVRVQPLVAPIMDNIYLDTYYFFVPMRLVWEHSKQFFGESDRAWTPSTEYTIPQMTFSKSDDSGYKGSLLDYFGIPKPKVSGGSISFSSLPFRAYCRIVDEWFRDQNTENPIYFPINDATVNADPDAVGDVNMYKGARPYIVNRYHDYFSSALPGQQKSDAVQVKFLLDAYAPVRPVGGANGGVLNAFEDKTYLTTLYPSLIWGTHTGAGTGRSTFRELNDTELPDGKALGLSAGNPPSSGSPLSQHNNTVGATTTGAYGDRTDLVPYNLFTDLSGVELFDVNNLRTAFAVQKYYERLARSGSRYTEYVQSMFSVTSPDARLQRSEYLGGNRIPLNVSTNEQTSATVEGTTPQGNLTGVSHTADENMDFEMSFTEHGFIIGVMCTRIDHSYSQGLPRMWSRQTLFDFYNPLFANLSETAVKKKELYADGSANDDLVFGFNESWADYRYKPSIVTSEMRSDYATPLDMWHLGDNYNSHPALSHDWMKEDKSILDRCLAVTSDVSDQFFCDLYIQMIAKRPMPTHSIPGLIDHH